MQATPKAAYLAIFGALSCFITIPPLIIQIQNRNMALSTLIAIVFTQNFIHLLNALIWHSPDPSTWWDGRIVCDIEIRLLVGLQVATPGASLCIFRNLSHVFHPSMCLPTESQKRWTKIIEVLLCVVVPLLRIAALYVVQCRRYYIFGVYGCTWDVDSSWPSYVLNLLWPPIISVVALLYLGITTRRMILYRKDMNLALTRGQVSNNKSRTKRVYWFCFLLFMINTPIQAYYLYRNIPSTLESFSWSRIHPPDWSERIIMVNLPANTGAFALSEYTNFLTGILAFMSLGFGSGAIEKYKHWIVQCQALYCRLSSFVRLSVTTDVTPSNHPLNNVQERATDRHGMEVMQDFRRDQEAM